MWVMRSNGLYNIFCASFFYFYLSEEKRILVHFHVYFAHQLYLEVLSFGIPLVPKMTGETRIKHTDDLRQVNLYLLFGVSE